MRLYRVIIHIPFIFLAIFHGDAFLRNHYLVNGIVWVCCLYFIGIIGLLQTMNDNRRIRKEDRLQKSSILYQFSCFTGIIAIAIILTLSFFLNRNNLK